MSLLMDALKRAEKARQAEASSDGAELDPASTQGFKLDPIEDPLLGERTPRPREPTLDQPVAPSAAPESPPSGGLDLELENTGQMAGRLGVEPRVEEIEIPTPEDTGESRPPHDEDQAPRAAMPEDTSATLPSLKSARESVDRYFDGTSSNSITVDDLQAAIAEEETAARERVVSDTDTQRRVRAVFHAKEASRSRRSRNWVTLALVPLLLLGLVGGAVFFFWDTLSDLILPQPAVQNRVQPSTATPPVPSVAVTQPAPATQTVPSPPATGGGTSSAPAGAAQVPAATAQTDSAPDGGATSATSGGGADAVPPASGMTTAGEREQATVSELVAPAPSVAEVTGEAPPSQQASPGPAASAPLSTSERVAQAIAQSDPLVASTTGGGAFKIRRRSVPDKLHPSLVVAYAAWQAGDYAAAKRNYQRVLKRDPRNRNALQGLAAIAVREKKWDEASEYYTRLLRINPRDSIAQAGMIAIQENIDPLRGESRIKLLLRAEPQAAHLHFTLGNLYAEQSRWGEAQAAYFNAYRLRSNNADYAFNLAVSLDQLGKRSSAITYYRLALELAEQNRAAFDAVAVQARIYSVVSESSE